MYTKCANCICIGLSHQATISINLAYENSGSFPHKSFIFGEFYYTITIKSQKINLYVS